METFRRLIRQINLGGVYDEKQMESFIRSNRDHFITYRLWYKSRRDPESTNG